MSINSFELRKTLGNYPTGVSLVTAIDAEGSAMGMIVGTFSSVSLDPPLVSFMPAKNSRTFQRLRTAETFCVNILGSEEETFSRRIASHPELGLDGAEWHLSPSGAPILDDALAWFECTYDAIIEAGDHYIVLGKVEDLGTVKPRSPLIFFQGGMGRFASPSMVVSDDTGLIEGAVLGEHARSEMETIAKTFKAECSVMVPVGPDLILVAKANHSDSSDGSLLGTRVPIMAPLGEAYVAFCDEAVIKNWFQRGNISENSIICELQQRLKEIRTKGWSMSLSGPAEERVLYPDFQKYSTGQLTPVEERDLSQKVSGLLRFYQNSEFITDQPVSTHSIVVPVFDQNERPIMILRLSEFSTSLSHAETENITKKLLESAAVLKKRLEAKSSVLR